MIRILLGAGEGLALPAIHSMIKKYVDKSSRSTSASIITAACYAGALGSNLLSPQIIDASGWRSCFYLFSVVPPLLWLPMWAIFLQLFSKKEDLDSNFLSSETNDEGISLMSIEKNKEDGKQASSDETIFPLTAAEEEEKKQLVEEGSILGLQQLLTCRPVWAIIAAQYGQSWGMIGACSVKAKAIFRSRSTTQSYRNFYFC